MYRQVVLVQLVRVLGTCTRTAGCREQDPRIKSSTWNNLTDTNNVHTPFTACTGTAVTVQVVP